MSRKLVFQYSRSVLPLRFWLRPFHYHWHWFRRSQWHWTRFRNDHGLVGTWQLNLGPITITKLIDLQRSDPHPADVSNAQPSR